MTVEKTLEEIRACLVAFEDCRDNRCFRCGASKPVEVIWLQKRWPETKWEVNGVATGRCEGWTSVRTNGEPSKEYCPSCTKEVIR